MVLFYLNKSTMNNIVRIILYIVGITLLYLWISTMMGSCNDSNSLDDVVENETETSVIDAEEYFEEDEFESGQTIDLSEDDSFETDGTSTDYTALDEAIDKSFDESEATPKATTSQTAPRQSPKPKTQTQSNSSGKHMVIAGNFLQEANANKMVTKLKNMGYTAEKVVFNNSQYHSVLAVRSNNYSSVSNVSSELKRNGIDNYIKTQK